MGKAKLGPLVDTLAVDIAEIFRVALEKFCGRQERIEGVNRPVAFHAADLLPGVHGAVDPIARGPCGVESLFVKIITHPDSRCVSEAEQPEGEGFPLGHDRHPWGVETHTQFVFQEGHYAIHRAPLTAAIDDHIGPHVLIAEGFIHPIRLRFRVGKQRRRPGVPPDAHHGFVGSLPGCHDGQVAQLFQRVTHITRVANVDRVAFQTFDGFGDLVIQAENYRPSTDSSTLKKIMKALNIDEVVIDYFDEDMEDDSVFREDRKEFTRPLKKKTFMHGTSLLAWKGIRKTGIRPMGHKTNFDHIRHDDKTFLTLNKEKALFHATTAMHKSQTAPIILELKIPDVDKLVMDYDVAIFNYGRDHKRTIELGYTEIDKHARNMFGAVGMSDAVNPDLRDIRNSGRESLSSKLGIFGYIGRIPAKFIEGVWFDEDAVTSTIYNDVFGGDVEVRGRGLSNWEFLTVKQFNYRLGDIEETLESEMTEDDL